MFDGAEKIITCLDISDSTLKILAVLPGKKGGSAVIMDCLKLPSTDEKAIAKEVRLILSKNKLFNSYIIVSFPRHLVTIKNVRLPTIDNHEIKNMAELQAIKYLPYSREEIVVSYRLISATQEGYSDILLALAQKKLIQEYINILKLAGVHPDKIGLSSEGIFNWYVGLNRGCADSVAIIDLDRYHAHIQIIRDSGLLFSRSVFFDAAFFERDKAAFLREIRLSFDTYFKEKNENVSSVLISGAADIVTIARDFLSKNIDIPCEEVTRIDSVKVKETEESSAGRFGEYSYTALYGFAAAPGDAVINLIPSEILEKRREYRARKEIIKSAVLLLCILVVIFAVMEKKMLEKRFYLKKVDEKLKTIGPEVERLSRLKDSAELIRGQLTLKGSAVDVIREIYAILPGDISLALLEFDDRDRILLRGTARELSSVFNFLPVLEKSPYFENAKVNFAAKRSFKQTEFADFEIICKMTKF